MIHSVKSPMSDAPAGPRLYSAGDRLPGRRRQPGQGVVDPPDVRGRRPPQAGARAGQGLRLHAGQSGDRAAAGGAGRLRAATGLPYTANHVLMTVGAGAALNTVLKALLNPGDEVLTVAPFFVEYTFYAENYGGRLVVVSPKDDLTPDIAKIEAAITPRTRAIILNSPNNPSGVIYPASTFLELERLLGRIAQPIVLISDE